MPPGPEPRDGEFAFIARRLAPLARGLPGAWDLKDDAAAITPRAGFDLILTKDLMVAGVHFLPDDPADLVARKLLRVNLSDLAAKGAVPLAVMLGLSVPRAPERAWLERFVDGLAQDLATYGIGLLGGDTTATPGPVTLSLTAIGEVPRGTAIRRLGARVGDRVCVTGTIGDGALGLKVLQDELAVDKSAADWLAGRYRLPTPRLAEGLALRGLAHACADISDGLVADLGHVCAVSGVGARIDREAVPLSPAAQAAVAADAGLWPAILNGGDDYELVFTLDPQATPPPFARVIGTIVAGQGVVVVDRTGEPMALSRAGWQHF
ncbi:thiamine-phosphate kinase [Zavarzinia sp. CC-PAN008]|uniref:thiamine-phosphate kinase n=1 Tax=Zavarzinia sp. CC-PAN008 TaxID=3243332 RepID=UPI003F748008